jgi:hypothetical protein
MSCCLFPQACCCPRDALIDTGENPLSQQRNVQFAENLSIVAMVGLVPDGCAVGEAMRFTNGNIVVIETNAA